MTLPFSFRFAVVASSQLYAHLGKDYSNRLISYALQLHMLYIVN